jgi:galactokinase
MITSSGAWTPFHESLYGPDPAILARQMRRWQDLFDTFRHRFGPSGARMFSTPGRTEIGGNHTDHNHGKVLAASVDLDAIAIAAPSGDERITVCSAGYKVPVTLSLDRLDPVPSEMGTTTALLRGIVSRFRQLGHEARGFHACIDSDVPVGSGLSSSAAIEVLLATILNALFNDSRIDGVSVAQVGQFAENVYFGKPCGLMDQIACSLGGIVKIDFLDPQAPVVEKVDFDFDSTEYDLLVVETGGNHADLTADYASIPREMKSVAARFGHEFCRQISEQDVLDQIKTLRATVGDRAILRALHFMQENRRVDLQVEALCRRDLPGFLRLVSDSGASSYRWLQNCIPAGAGAEQGVPLALALGERFVREYGGACRVHGGGFAGTILVFLPHKVVGAYVTLMESAFGAGAVKALRVRSSGSMEIG